MYISRRIHGDIRYRYRGENREGVTRRKAERRNESRGTELPRNVLDPDEIRTSACTTRVRDAGGRAHVAPTWRGVPFHIIQR